MDVTNMLEEIFKLRDEVKQLKEEVADLEIKLKVADSYFSHHASGEVKK